jgi:ABC-2 type transport system permease protein
MLNYLKAECFKVSRRKYPYLFLLFILLGEALILFTFWMVNTSTAHNNFDNTVLVLMVAMPIGLYLAVVVCDMVFSDQYKHNTLKNEVSFGISRTKLYMGKLIASVVVALVMLAAIMGFYLLGSLLCMPPGDNTALTMAGLGVSLLASLPLWLGAVGLTIALFFNIRSNVGAAFAAVGVIGFLPGALKMAALLTGNEIFLTIRSVCLLAPFDNLNTMVEANGLIGAWLIGMGWLIGSTVIGLLFFQRKEIS